MPTEQEKMDYLLLTELHFECDWFIESWNSIDLLNTRGDSPIVSDSATYNRAVWEAVDRLLTHAARIDRILNPRAWYSKDEAEFRRARFRFADTARKHIPDDVFSQEDLRTLRNQAEHLNEYLGPFGRGKDIDAINAFLIGPRALQHGSAIGPIVRGFDPISKVCVVLGERIDLSRTHDSVRKLKMALPPKHVVESVSTGDGSRVL